MSTRRDLDLAVLRQNLMDRRADVLMEDEACRAERAPVAVDQTSEGKMSVLTALEGHAMAEATHERRLAEIKRIDAALQRMEDGTYGYCLSCDAKIPARRLMLDPAVPTCVRCAHDAEQALESPVHVSD